ncbi:MAG: AraC family ligand binding domain-containing protein [Chloroflexota bacterium]|nr:AraC family ligand binding domain-containing protein [Chloroflexota bacterium]
MNRTLPPPLAALPWDRPDAPSAAGAALRLRDEGVEPHAWSNGPGDRYGVHSHAYTKLLVCAAGSITFLVGPDATPVELRPGDGFVLPPGMSHAAVVGPTGCTCLEGSR